MTYNLTRDYPELNTPDHIFQEWEFLSINEKPVQKNQSFTKITSENQLEDAKVQFSCEFNLLNGMLNSKDAKSLYPSLISLNDQIFDFVFEFSGIQSIKEVKEIVNRSNQSSIQARKLVSYIKSSSEKVLLKLSLLKTHTEFLVNPKFPQSNYFNIISTLMQELYIVLMEFIKNIQQFSASFIPIEKIVMSANPDFSSSSIELFSPSQSQSQFSSLGNDHSNSAIFYPTLLPLDIMRIPLNRSNQKSRKSKYIDSIQKIFQLIKKLHQTKKPKKDDFTSIITTLCELNNLKNIFSEMYAKVRAMNPDTVLSLTHINAKDLEAMYNKKEKLESQITYSAQRENAREFGLYIDDYSVVVDQLLDAFKKCL